MSNHSITNLIFPHVIEEVVDWDKSVVAEIALEGDYVYRVFHFAFFLNTLTQNIGEYAATEALAGRYPQSYQPNTHVYSKYIWCTVNPLARIRSTNCVGKDEVAKYSWEKHTLTRIKQYFGTPDTWKIDFL